MLTLDSQACAKYDQKKDFGFFSILEDSVTPVLFFDTP